MRHLDAIRLCCLLLGACWLCGCLPLPDQESEEKNPLILDARAKKSAYNFQGAVASLEKALEANPRLALAHWELGLIFCQHLSDPAGAIYHFNKLLKLQPGWRHAETARQKIRDCQVEIAKSVPLGPQLPAFQQQFDRMVSRVHDTDKELNQLRVTNQTLHMYVQQLRAENAQLREALRTASAASAASALPATTAASGALIAAAQPRPPSETQQSNRAASGPDPARSAPVSPRPNAAVNPSSDERRPLVSTSSAPAVPAPRSYLQYTVRRGETMSTIARRYGLPLRTLLSANPNVNPNRLNVGQVIRIPAT